MNPPNLTESATKAIEAAVANGARDAEAYAQDSTGREIRVHGGKVESLTEATERGIGVRAWIEGRVGYAYGTDLSAAGLKELGAAAAEGARVADPDEFAAPPEAASSPPLDGLSDPALSAWTVRRKVELALAIEVAALAEPSVHTVEETVYADEEARVAIVSSHGASGSYEATSCYAYAHALAGEGAELQTGLGFGLGRSPEALDAAAIGGEAADRAAAQLGATKPSSRACPIVLDPTVAASFVSYIGGTLGADAVQRGRSPLAGRLGDAVASASFDLADDGLDTEGHAAAPFDDEGTPHRRTPLIEGGTLRAYLHDAYTARRGGEAPTGNAARSGYRSPPSVSPSNLVVGTGDDDLDALLRRAADGVYVTHVAGLHSGVNPISGVFSVGASGRRIAGGALAEPLREFTIAGDLLSMLAAIEATGADARWVPFGGSVKTPPLLISNMTISGK